MPVLDRAEAMTAPSPGRCSTISTRGGPWTSTTERASLFCGQRVLVGLERGAHVEQAGLRRLRAERQVGAARSQADRLVGQRLTVDEDAQRAVGGDVRDQAHADAEALALVDDVGRRDAVDQRLGSAGAGQRHDVHFDAARLQQARLGDRVAGGFLAVGEQHDARAVAGWQQVGRQAQAGGEVGAVGLVRRPSLRRAEGRGDASSGPGRPSAVRAVLTTA